MQATHPLNFLTFCASVSPPAIVKLTFCESKFQLHIFFLFTASRLGSCLSVNQITGVLAALTNEFHVGLDFLNFKSNADHVIPNLAAAIA